MIALADVVTALPWLKPDGFLCEVERRWVKRAVLPLGRFWSQLVIWSHPTITPRGQQCHNPLFHSD